MSSLNFFKKMQEYARNPNNGYLDDIYLDVLKHRQRIGKPLTKKQKEFLNKGRVFSQDS